MIRIAGLDIAVRANSATALRVVTDALVGQGSRSVDGANPATAWRIDLLDGEGGSTLPLAWTWENAVVTDEQVELRCDVTTRTITMLCRGERWAMVWRDGFRIHPWERAAPLRPVLDNVFGSIGLTMVHGGTLGIDGRAVLISARGGSGKSTCVVAGLRRGLESVGDDFVLLDPQQEVGSSPARVRSLYRTARLHRSSPAWRLEDVAAPDENELRTEEDKSLILLAERYPQALKEHQVVDAVFVPELGHAEPAIEAMSRMEALRAVLPSSLILADRRTESFARITAFVRETAAYRLRLSPDVERNTDAIRAFLQRLGA